MKNLLLNKVIKDVEERLHALIQSALDAHSAATDSESKAENKYDTRGLEASYLAGAQSKRVGKLKESLYHLQKIKAEDLKLKDKVELCSVVTLLDEDDVEKKLFVLPVQGGIIIDHDKVKYQVITFSSPLGKSIYNKKIGDEAYMVIGSEKKFFEIIDIQ